MLYSHRDDDKKEQLSEQSLSLDREIITVGVGACGNRMSSGFWRNILDEHNIDFDGKLMENDDDDYIVDNTRIGTYFREQKDIKNKFVPRHIICDLDVTTIDSVRASNLGSLFSADSYIYAGNSANNLYSLGYNSVIIDDILEEIRNEAEKCSSVQGFKLLHSLGGGTGSGLTSYLAQLLKDEYYDRLITSYTVYPSNQASDIVIEPYNFMLSMPSLLSYHDINSCIDNETLFDISSRLFHNERPDFRDLNEYICNIISSSTAGIRFKGSLNMDLRKLAMNILPFPRLKFISISDAPLMYNHARKYTKISIETLITELFHGHQYLSNIDVGQEVHGWNGKYLAASIVFRGSPINEYNIKLNEWEIVNGLRKTLDELRYSEEALSSIPNNLHSTLIFQPSPSYPLTGTLFANNTAIKDLFKRNMKRFKKFYDKKAFIQYYINNGTLNEDFEEAINETNDLLEEYNDKDSQSNESIWDQDQYQFELNTKNRKKLQKNQDWWSQLGGNRNHKKQRKQKKNRNKRQKLKIMRKNKKIYVKPKKNSNKRIVINKKKLNNKKKISNKNNNNKKKKKKEESSDTDDFEEESSSDDDQSDSDDDSDDSEDSEDSQDSQDSDNSDNSSSTDSDNSDHTTDDDEDDDDDDDEDDDSDTDDDDDDDGTSSYGLGDKSSSKSSENEDTSSDTENNSNDSTDSERTDTDSNDSD